jgi:lysophospholipid acyltransferase (LPLAT)-like uncharacterized protein
MRPLRSKIIQAILARLLSLYVDFALETMRWRFYDTEGVDAAVASPDGFIGAFWHGRISLAVVCRRVLKHKPRRVLISMSRDGEFVAQTVERLGFPGIRGSAAKKGKDGGKDKGGTAAFRQALKFMRDGGCIAVTPDGPRGPNQVMTDGPLILAQTGGAPVFLFGLAAKPGIRLGGWDDGILPVPFTRGCVVFDGPLIIDRRADAEAREAIRAEWQARLIAAQHRAEDILAGKHG